MTTISTLHVGAIYTNFTRRLRRHIRSRKEGVMVNGQKTFTLPCPNWIEELVHTLAKRMAVRMGMKWEVMGPAGLTSAVFVTFYPKGENRESDNALHMTIEPGSFFGGERAYLLVRDYKASVDSQYPKGTIGHMNGMHIAKVQIPEDADVDWFKPYMG